MKYHTIIICILAIAILYPSKVHAFDYPNDQPTIEALISLHKIIKKEEEKALEKVAASYGEQSLVTKGATKFNDVRHWHRRAPTSTGSLIPMPSSRRTRQSTPLRSLPWHGTIPRPTSPVPVR